MCADAVALILATQVDATPIVVQFEDPEREPVTCKGEADGKPIARPLQQFEGQTALERAILAAYRAQVGMVYVLAAPELGSEVTRIAHSVRRRRFDPSIQVLEVDPDALAQRANQVGNLEVFGIPYGILEIAHALAGQGLERFGSVVLMYPEQVRIDEHHIFELCREFKRDSKLDAVTSWILWLRRPPYLFASDFLDRLVERAQAVEGGLADVPLLHLNVRECVFGEEKLAVNAIPLAGVEAFLKKNDMTALQAVALAQHNLDHPDEPLYSPNQQLSLQGPVAKKKVNGADYMLVNAAKDLKRRVADASADEREELAWADAFGKRNRLDFPLLNDRAHAGKFAYLDSAATAQRVDVALRAQRDFDEHENANIYRGAYDLSAQATFSYNEARAVVEGFIGAERRSLVFTANTTASINLVAQAWGERNIGEDDLVLTTVAEHHSALLPFIMLAQRKGVQVEYLPYDENGRIDAQAYADALARCPKIVVLAQVGNVFGIEAPIAQMAQAAHEAGARVLVDAAQSFGHGALDVCELGADWVAFSAHKAYGPMGIGGLWISAEAFGEMDPVASGGGAISHVSKDSYYLRPKGIQYELGTPPVSQAIGFAAAVRYLQDLGMGDVARHAAILTRYAAQGLARIPGVKVVGDHSGADGQKGIVAFTVAGAAPAQVSGFLGKLGVAIRAGGHCALPLHASLGLIGTARISMGVYTTLDDVDAALVAVQTFTKLLK